ncbi:uncharacterized protein [Blastocystis hominis]|uniref:Mitochondrial carrier protein n=1 Tax=Blastocystis hominis TaxID=12968 RepID=D8M8W0_BLAHO|nr:uncharacterized protein [Blastocystis hominis]CBK24499.2 unnamed protein product [Blastocystis hominis]|eukprot:XP_012898547.1 uncharacterized protein [Blastocystis hominis]
MKGNGRGLFSGLVPTILRDAPNSGLYICFYHTIKPSIMSLHDTYNTPITLLNLLTGIIAGISATFLTHPFDMIKTQMQLNNGDPNYLTVRSTVKTIVNNSLGVKDKNRLVHAFKSIYTGGFMRISKRAINSTITW